MTNEKPSKEKVPSRNLLEEQVYLLETLSYVQELTLAATNNEDVPPDKIESMAYLFHITRKKILSGNFGFYKK